MMDALEDLGQPLREVMVHSTTPGLRGTSETITLQTDSRFIFHAPHTKARSDDSTLSGAVKMPEGRDAIQRNLDKLEKWGRVSLMRFNKAKDRVLHLGQSNHWYRYRLGVKGWRATLPRRTWGCWGMKSWT